MKTLLKHAKLLDAAYLNEPLDVLVEDGKIAAIGTDLAADTVIDLSGCTLMPGFIDAHVHVAVEEGAFSDKAIRAWAMNGVTSVRELGMLSTLPMEAYAAWISKMNADPKNAKVVATGKYIDIAGGYGCGPEPHKIVGNVAANCKEAEAFVEKAHALGFPGIKIGISDGFPGAPRMENDMIEAICRKAKELGMWTACHIGKSETLQTMVDCGISETGHTPNDAMPDSLIAEMVAKNIPMDTTVGDPDAEMGPPPGMMMPGGPDMPPMGPPMGPPMEPSEAGPMGRGQGGPGGMPFDPAAMAEQKKEQMKVMVENLRRFYLAGGKIVIGTDLIHSTDYTKDAVIPVVELRHLASIGMELQEIIKTGTLYAAQVIGTEQEEGTITVGKEANLIAVAGEVDMTFEALRSVPFVMHYGTIIKNQL